MINMKMVEDLTNAFGPSGFEKEACKVVKKYVDELGNFELKNDSMWNLYMKNKNFSGKKPVIMLDAHLDECGFMVQSVNYNGQLSIIMLGGMHLTSLPAHSVIIKNKYGEKIRGIIASKPVHFLNAKEKVSNDLDIESIFVDVGASSREEVYNDYGIYPGCPVMPDVTFDYDEKHGTCFGKAFDNRMGCVSIIETMKELMYDENLAVDVVGGFAAQEEVGGRGAKVTAAQVKPDLAIVFEGSPADDYFFPEGLAQGSLGKGVQIRRMDTSYISNDDFIELAEKVGNEKGIKYQEAVRRGGGTNAGPISVSGKSIPVLVLGIPCRYVHSHYNFCAKVDIEETVRMAAEVIRSLDEETINKILRVDAI